VATTGLSQLCRLIVGLGNIWGNDVHAHTLLSYLPIASFALASAGVVVKFFPPSVPAKQHLITAILIFLMLTCGVLWQQDHEHEKEVRRAANDIIEIIGNDKRTYDEIIGSLRQPDYQVDNDALTLLIDENRIGSEDDTIADKPPSPLRVRRYYVRTF
jgi:hypothetical protein